VTNNSVWLYLRKHTPYSSCRGFTETMEKKHVDKISSRTLKKDGKEKKTTMKEKKEKQ